MQEFYTWISGNVPGGFLLLSFVLLTVNVALYFLYRSSKLFNRDVYKRKGWQFNLSIFALYIFLWIYLRPPQLPPRFAILPFQKGETVDLRLCNALEYTLMGKFDREFIRHRWEWFYETANKDSLEFPAYRDTLADRLGIDFLVTGTIHPSEGRIEVTCAFGKPFDQDTFTVSADSELQLAGLLTAGLKKRTRRFDQSADPGSDIENLLANAGIEKQLMDHAQNLKTEEVKGDSPNSVALSADILLRKGIKDKPKRAGSSDLVTQENNPAFLHIQKLLIPYSREEKDTEKMNLVLGQMYLHMRNYGMAEVCLKKALAQDPYDARIYYYLSFLHDSRIEEYGFKDREQVLTRAIRLDPGYSDAALALADDYYFSGSGSSNAQGTTKALGVINEFLKINPLAPDILNLLGRIYLQTKYTREAMGIYRKLVDLHPDSATYNFNLGVSLYQLKSYDEAEKCFRRAIDLRDDVDAYLYLGAIFKQRGQLKQALEYFRERIRRKTGPEDHYAREAMRQVRLIRSELGLDSLDAGDLNQN
jgi:tetratricopeptide (TPR) repeat protein